MKSSRLLRQVPSHGLHGPSLPRGIRTVVLIHIDRGTGVRSRHSQGARRRELEGSVGMERDGGLWLTSSVGVFLYIHPSLVCVTGPRTAVFVGRWE